MTPLAICTARQAAAAGNRGIVFKLDPSGNETVLYTFQKEPDGSQPNGGLIQDAAGNFYGTTVWGGKGSARRLAAVWSSN